MPKHAPQLRCRVTSIRVTGCRLVRPAAVSTPSVAKQVCHCTIRRWLSTLLSALASRGWACTAAYDAGLQPGTACKQDLTACAGAAGYLCRFDAHQQRLQWRNRSSAPRALQAFTACWHPSTIKPSLPRAALVRVMLMAHRMWHACGVTCSAGGVSGQCVSVTERRHEIEMSM